MNETPSTIEKDLGSSLFFFAHQDDEFGVFHSIATEQKLGREVWCLYLTSGGDNANRRNTESLRVLSDMGVSSSRILFSGQDLGVEDGRLLYSMEALAKWLNAFISTVTELRAVYVPAWEGGHPDHDALHFLVTYMMHDRGEIELVRQFPLYNSWKCVRPFFRVMSPLDDNGEVVRYDIELLARARYILYCLRYPSQIVSWLGLFPFVALSYSLSGCQYLQKVNVFRLHTRPHLGQLYYEARGFATWQEVERNLAKFRSTLCSG
jgi:LmbE family N-acetylglucosaminyl deacetylase